MSELDPTCKTTMYVGLMPSKVLSGTEDTWEDLFGAGTDFQPTRFDRDPRFTTEPDSAEYLRSCEPFSQVALRASRFMATGANYELTNVRNPRNSQPLPFERIPWIKPLDRAMDWADKRAEVALYICLAGHRKIANIVGADYRLFDDRKTIGVYDHDVTAPDHPLMRGIGDTITAPHARWGNLPAKILRDSGIEVLAEGEVGWLLAARERETEDGQKAFDIFSNGHLEYDPDDVSKECFRDLKKGLRIAVPRGYENPDHPPECEWEEDRSVIYQNARSLPETT
jgi:hypothetical protein